MNPNTIRTSALTPPPAIREFHIRPWDRPSSFIEDLLKNLSMPNDGFSATFTPNNDPFANGWNAAMKFQHDHPVYRRLPMPVNVIFHDPATIVFWDDGDKTVVKCQPGDTFSAETGLTTAMLKKYMGNDNTFNKVINEWMVRSNQTSTPALPEAVE